MRKVFSFSGSKFFNHGEILERQDGKKGVETWYGVHFFLLSKLEHANYREWPSVKEIGWDHRKVTSKDRQNSKHQSSSNTRLHVGDWKHTADYKASKTAIDRKPISITVKLIKTIHPQKLQPTMSSCGKLKRDFFHYICNEPKIKNRMNRNRRNNPLPKPSGFLTVKSWRISFVLRFSVTFLLYSILEIVDAVDVTSDQ